MQIGSKYAYDPLKAAEKQTRTAASVFGDQTSGSDVFRITAGGTDAASSNELIAKGMQRELNKLLGYKPQLTVAESNKLKDLRGKIQSLESIGQTRALTNSQRTKLGELYAESYEILGREPVDIEGNTELSALNQQINTLLERELTGAPARRLERLESQAESIGAAIDDGDSSRSTRQLLTNVQIQIAKLAPPRSVKELTPSERNEYDELVNEINTKAGQTVILNSEDRIRASQLRQMISALQSGGGGGLGGTFV